MPANVKSKSETSQNVKQPKEKKATENNKNRTKNSFTDMVVYLDKPPSPISQNFTVPSLPWLNEQRITSIKMKLNKKSK